MPKLWVWHPVLTPLRQDHAYCVRNGNREYAKDIARAYALARWHRESAEILMSMGRDEERSEHTCY